METKKTKEARDAQWMIIANIIIGATVCICGAAFDNLPAMAAGGGYAIGFASGAFCGGAAQTTEER